MIRDPRVETLTSWAMLRGELTDREAGSVAAQPTSAAAQPRNRFVAMNSELRGRARRLLIEAVYSYGGDREERLTEVLASVLEVHPDLCRLLTRRAGLRSDVERFGVETQVGAPGQRR